MDDFNDKSAIFEKISPNKNALITIASNQKVTESLRECRPVIDI